MKIKTSDIPGYEQMTAEEKVKALEALELKEPDLSGYVAKSTFDKKTSELAEITKKYRATLDDSEKKALEDSDRMQSLEAEVKALRAEKQVADITSKYISLGYDDKVAKETAQAFMDGDMSKVFSNQKKFLEQREAAIKAEILKNTPQPPAGGASNEITKEQFDKMGYSERAQLYAENRDLYNELNGGNE